MDIEEFTVDDTHTVEGMVAVQRAVRDLAERCRVAGD